MREENTEKGHDHPIDPSLPYNASLFDITPSSQLPRRTTMASSSRSSRGARGNCPTTKRKQPSIGFNTKTDNSAANAAKREGVQIKLYSIIYELVDQIKEAMAGLLDPELRESQIGTATVKKVFSLSKYPVAGCVVSTGRIARNARARVVRRKQPIYDGGIQTLKRFQDEASEVRSGMECGIRLGDFNEYEEGDVIECYQLEKVPQSL